MSVAQPVQPVNQRALKDQIVEAVQKAIISGRYGPGQWLVERELADTFQVSSIPVREALQDLEAQGLVTRRRNRGCYVTQLSQAEIENLIRLRDLIEPQVAHWTAQNLTDEDADLLEEQLVQMQQAARRRDVPEFFYRDLMFHRLVWRLSGNPYAGKILESIVAPLFAAGLTVAGHLQKPDLKAEAEKHQRFLNALRAHRGAEASRILIEICTGFDASLGRRTGA
jgi:DNA-binding GntR family transcriptional regulator